MDVQPSHCYIECQVPIRKGLKINRFAIIDGSSFVIDEIACASFQKLKDYYNTLVKYPFDHKDFVLNRKEDQAEFFADKTCLHGAEEITIKTSSAHRDVLIIRPRPLHIRSD